MKKILETLRQKWAEYLLEIFVIMFGILGAFILNNWNESMKEKKFEQKILNDVRTSMQVNFWQLNSCIQVNAQAVLSCKIILNHFNENIPYHDSLDVHFSKAIEWCAPILNNAGYESLKSYGINIITNDSIRENLNIYNAGWIETLASRQEEYFFNTASPILTELFESVAMRSEMKPFDFNELKKSRKYHSILKTSIAYREDQRYWYELWLENLEEIEKMIDEELKD